MIQEEISFGTINFDDVLNEDSFGSLNLKGRKGSCKIFVRSNEGPIPHFHLKADDKSWELCVRLDSGHYFTHGPYVAILNSKQAKQLDDFLSEVYKKECRWKEMVDCWNESNPGFKTDVKIKPDYTRLYNYKLD